MEIKYPSPSGNYHFQIHPVEMRMSLWVESPRLIETQKDRCLMELTSSGTFWSLEGAKWRNGEHVEMQLRRYPGDHSPSHFEVEVDCLAKQATIGGDTVELSSLEIYLEALYRRSQDRPTPAPSRSGCLMGLLSLLRA